MGFKKDLSIDQMNVDICHVFNQANLGSAVGLLLLWYSFICTVESLPFYILVCIYLEMMHR